MSPECTAPRYAADPTNDRESDETMKTETSTAAIGPRDPRKRPGYLNRVQALVGLLAAACLALAVGPGAAQAFDVVDFSADSFDSGGLLETQAGAHPFMAQNVIEVSTTNNLAGQPIPDGNIKDVIVDLPAGFAGNPQMVPTCKPQEFALGACPLDSQVGQMFISFSYLPTVPFSFPVFNMEPPQGTPAQFGFVVLSVPVFINAGVRPGDNGLRMKILSNSQALPIVRTQLELWGVPASSAHDMERGDVVYGACSMVTGGSPPCPVTAPITPFLSNPADCSTPPVTKLRINSWQQPQDWKTATFVGDPLTGCEQVAFDPGFSAQPSSHAAATPSGYRVELTAAQDDNPDGLATANLKKAEVTLPEGVTVNPAVAKGLGACSPQQIGLGTDSPVACPDSSKIGQVRIVSPLQEAHLSGGVYVAKQNDNPFDSTLAIYLTPSGGGVELKLPGEITPDPATGQLTATFDDNPQLPFDSFVLDFKGGPGAPLVNPPTCGTKTTVASLSSWSAADPDNPTAAETVRIESSFQVTSGPKGTPCATTPADRPFQPTMSAGLLNPVAGAHSPFILDLARDDSDQELGALRLNMPAGISAKLAGVAYCPDATLAAVSSAEGSGAAENASPSCPASSHVGSATVGAGAGSSPYYVRTGKAYLAGPYKGAQLSLAVVVPALAGPFDLGSVVVRNALHINPRTAQITVISDRLPQILHGIPLKIQDLRIDIDRPGFMVSPTDCSAKQITAQVRGVNGKSAALANRFQVGGCAGLGFNPKLKLDFGKSKKNTRRNAHPPMHANLSFNPGDANVSSVEVALPKGVLLDQERLGRICSRANYAAETCPAESRVGYAKATTPLLANPVEGPVYLKSSNNPLPDLAADLNGQIDIDLFGKIDQKENKKGLNQIRNTFDVVPDVPVSHFQLTLDGGDDGLLVNSRNICKSKRTQKAKIEISGHNGMATSDRSRIGSACKKINKKKAKRLKKKVKKLKRKAKRADSHKKTKKLRKKAKQLKRQYKKLRR